MTPSTQPLADLLRDQRVVVCVGAGGVGKTTVSAALGVAAARMGKRTLVLTVDPARRLANALGLQAFEEHIQRVQPGRFAPGHPKAVALDVAMLDVKSTFDRVVERYTDSPKTRDAILNNNFYQQASTALAGSQEYMAMQRLYEVVVDEPYELIVLDTPPSAHALDFLDAPRRMIELFGSRAFRKLLEGFGSRGSGPGRMFSPKSLLMRGLGRFTSADMFHNLLGFFAALSETFDGFVRGAEDVLALLHSDATAFVIVSAPDEGSTHEGLFLRRRLLDERMKVGAWVLNRVRGDRTFETPPDASIAIVREALGDGVGDADVGSICRAARLIADMTSADATHAQKLAEQLENAPALVSLARAEVEPASLVELARLASALTSEKAVFSG